MSLLIILPCSYAISFILFINNEILILCFLSNNPDFMHFIEVADTGMPADGSMVVMITASDRQITIIKSK